MEAVILVVLLIVAYFVYTMVLRPNILVKRINKIAEETRKHRIESITESGFTIYTGGIPENVEWATVKSMEFMDGETLVITHKWDKQVTMLPTCISRLELLRKIPKGIEKFDYESVDKFFNDLQLCKICGFFALENDECLNCQYTLEHEKEFKGDKSEEEFCKEEQLDYFTTYFDNTDTVEKILKDAAQNEVFKKDPNWKIYPTKEEIAEEKKKYV